MIHTDMDTRKHTQLSQSDFISWSTDNTNDFFLCLNPYSIIYFHFHSYKLRVAVSGVNSLSYWVRQNFI